MTNVEMIREAYQEWHETRGLAISKWLEVFAPDIAIRSLADGAPGMDFSAPRNGLAEAEVYLNTITQAWEMLHFTPEEFVSEGDRVVMLGRCGWRCKATSKSVESPIVHLWRFRDGKAVEFMEFYDTAKAFAASQASDARAP